MELEAATTTASTTTTTYTRVCESWYADAKSFGVGRRGSMRNRVFGRDTRDCLG